MNTIAQFPGTSESTRRLIEAVARDLATAQTSPGSRDLGPDAADAAPAAIAPDQDAQRFFGSIVQSLVTHVVPKLATTVIGLLQQRRRELGLPEQRDTASVERDFESILNSFLPSLLQSVPIIANALSGKPAPRDATEEGQRFLPLLGAIIPAAISCVPGIISAFNRQRGADATPPPISNSEVAERFIGPLLQTFVPQLLQAAPTIIESLFPSRRDFLSGQRAVGTVW